MVWLKWCRKQSEDQRSLGTENSANNGSLDSKKHVGGGVGVRGLSTTCSSGIKHSVMDSKDSSIGGASVEMALSLESTPADDCNPDIISNTPG